MSQTRPRARNRGAVTRALTSLALAGGLGLPAAEAVAVEVAPGMSVPLAGTTAAANPDLAGSIAADDLRPFEIRVRPVRC